MSIPHRVRGVKILKAVSSSLRLQILNLLFDRGPLSYTELMSSLKMNPTRDAGRFAYHLKFLLRADLIEADVEAKKYCLTELGKMVIDVADRIEKKAIKPKSMLIRTSRFALEEFDANKIANSLIKEAKMPAELAQKVAKEAEKRLLKSKIKYLTAPLVREVVNAVLIEKGLEEYRHKLTRLGLPVYDVASLLEGKETGQQMGSVSEKLGETILREYMLLNMFPRDVADAHLSGSIFVEGLGSWILKPSEVMHDLRFFLQHGLNLERINVFKSSLQPPNSLESALSTTFNVLLHSAREVDAMQTLDYFNVFLAPFVKGTKPTEVKEALRSFILQVNQHVKASLGLELTVPDFMAGKQVLGSDGKVLGKYGDFVDESQLLASFILEILIEESLRKPLLNPAIILEVRKEAFVNEKVKAMLLKAHQLASEKSMLYFANLLGENKRDSVFSSSGFTLKTDACGDWEIETLRTGCLGRVGVNLPRIVVESGKDKTKFLEIFKERLEMAVRALEIKYRTLKQHGGGLLPFLSQEVNGDQYFRLENCSRIINMVGLKESAEIFSGKSVYEDEKSLAFAEEVIQQASEYINKIGRKHDKNVFLAALPSFEASERFAQLDIERYGVAKVRFSGTREKPFYSTVGKLILKDDEVLPTFLKVEEKLSKLFDAGGYFSVIELGEAEHKPEALMALTKQIFESGSLEFFTYNRKLTYCVNCKRSWFGKLQKCPSCGAVSTLAFFDQFAAV
ncbi:MAG: anaerobic ribonucleoside-triphosphate reductase [Candidatus Bathyarchaeia archaeon]